MESFEPIDLVHGQGKTNPTHSFVDILNEKQEIQTHALLLAINKLAQNPTTELKNCDLVFAKFLLEVSKQCCSTVYGLFGLIFRALREMLNLYGYILMTKLEQVNTKLNIEFKGVPDNDVFTTKENCDYVPITYDFFLKEFFQSYLGTVDFNFDFVIKFLFFFNQWLVKYNLTKIQLKHNSF